MVRFTISSWFTVLASLLLSSSTLSLAQNDTPKPCAALPLPAKTIFQFNQTGTWIENIAARRNGDLIFTMALPKAQVYLLSKPSSPEKPWCLTMLHEFTNINSLRGIAEPRPDVFVMGGGSVYPNRQPMPGSFGIYEVAFQNGSNFVASRKVVDIPDARFLNGMAVPGTASAGAQSSGSDSVFVGDSQLGVVYRVDVKNNTYEMAIQSPEMAPIANAAPAPFGINGMKIRDGNLLFSNTNDRGFYKIKLDSTGLKADENTKVEKLAAADKATIFLDDFDVGSDGVIWATTNPNNTVLAVDPNNGKSVVAAGGLKSLTVAGATAAIFGRAKDDGSMLYVVTSGAQGIPVNGTVTEPAKVVQVDTSGFASCRTAASSTSSSTNGTGSSGSGSDKGNSADRRGVPYVYSTAFTLVLWFLI